MFYEWQLIFLPRQYHPPVQECFLKSSICQGKCSTFRQNNTKSVKILLQQVKLSIFSTLDHLLFNFGVEVFFISYLEATQSSWNFVMYQLFQSFPVSLLSKPCLFLFVSSPPKSSPLLEFVNYSITQLKCTFSALGFGSTSSRQKVSTEWLLCISPVGAQCRLPQNMPQ